MCIYINTEYWQEHSFKQQCKLSWLFSYKKLRRIIFDQTTAQHQQHLFSIFFFNSQLKVWEYAKISTAKFEKLLFDDRSSILKKYYVDMCTKYLVGADKMFSVSFLVAFGLFFGLFLCCFFEAETEKFSNFV